MIIRITSAELTISSNEDILRLQISVNDIVAMHVLKSHNDLSSYTGEKVQQEARVPQIPWNLTIEDSSFPVEVSNAPKVREELPSNDVLHQHIEILIILESTIPRNVITSSRRRNTGYVWKKTIITPRFAAYNKEIWINMDILWLKVAKSKPHIQVNNKGVSNGHKNVLFIQNMINLLQSNNICLLQDLDCIIFSGFAMPC